jgi:hypothetical protein
MSGLKPGPTLEARAAATANTGSFAMFRMTAKNKQRQVQQRIPCGNNNKKNNDNKKGNDSKKSRDNNKG